MNQIEVFNPSTEAATAIEFQAGQQIAKPASRGVIIVAPAWHSCGSYEVFKNQVSAFKALGFTTYFLAVSPKLKAWRRLRGFWNYYFEMTQDIEADFRGNTGRMHGLLMQGALWRHVLPSFRNTLVIWKTLPAKLAPLPTTLLQFVAESRNIDIVCNHYFNMPLAEKIRALVPGSRIILETHDVQSRHFSDQKLPHPVTKRFDSYENMLTDEISVCSKADILVHLNENEARLFKAMLPNHRHEIVFPMAHRAYNHGDRYKATEERFDFLIVMSANYPNYLSLRWFLEKVWSPTLDRRFNLKIVGNIDWEFKSRNDRLYQRYQTRFLGRVSSVAPYYYACGIVLLPVTAGHGVAIKTIEAMAYGKPIIATPLAFRGFDSMVSLEILESLARTPEQFREKLVERTQGGYPKVDWQLVNIFEKLFGPEAYRKRYREILDRHD